MAPYIGLSLLLLTAILIAQQSSRLAELIIYTDLPFSLLGSIGAVLTPPGSPVPVIDSWPNALNFVHVNTNVPNVRPELAANPAAFGAGLGQQISPALLDFFLPDRKNFLLGQLNAARSLPSV